MFILVERKIFKIGEGGFAITLPKTWINFHHLRHGDKVEIVIDDSLVVRIKEKEEIEKQDSSTLES